MQCTALGRQRHAHRTRCMRIAVHSARHRRTGRPPRVRVHTPAMPSLGLERHRYDYVSALEGCAAFNRTQSLKFFMGHTHCNDVHPHGRVGAGFRVAGQGMEGCGNYGVPVLDTTEQRIRIWCAGGRLR